MPFHRLVRSTRGGDFELRLSPGERDLLRTLPAQLRELLSIDDPALERLFPPAYTDDAQAQAEYHRLVHDDLVESKRTSLQVLEETIDAERLTEEQVTAWLGAVNDLRLVLGSTLQVTEDMEEEDLPPDHPRAAGLGLYHYLSLLEEHIVEALSSGMDPAGTERLA
jgi:hypothetical protein